jgi:Tfp pilus assembly protein PilN
MSAPNQLSFLPEDYLDRKAQRRTNVICAILAAIVMIAIGSAFTFTERMMQTAQRRHAVVEQRYAQAAQEITEVRDMEEKQRKMAHQAELAASLLEKIPRSIILAEVTNCLPVSVYLVNFDLASQRVHMAPPPAPKNNDGKKAPPPPPEPITYDVTLRLTGIAANDLQVAQFIRNLSHCPLFSDVNLIISDQTTRDHQPVRHFEIVMSLNNDADVTSLDINRTLDNATAQLPQN